MFKKLVALIILFLCIFAPVSQIRAAIVDVYVSGTITFVEESDRDPALPQSVVDSVLGLLPAGSNLSARLVVDTATPDASTDPDIGDYQGAVTQASFLVNGFAFPLDTGFCNPNFDCKLKVQNDFNIIPGIGALDQISMSAPVFQSVELGATVSAETGVIPGTDTSSGFIPFSDPTISGALSLFETDFDLVDSDAIFDPLTAPFDEAGFSIFLGDIRTPSLSGTILTILEFRVDSLRISDSPILPQQSPSPPPSGYSAQPCWDWSGLTSEGKQLNR